MFFSLAKHPDPRFPNQHQFESWWLNVDNGWMVNDANAVKGYQHASQFDGNRCAITFANNQVIVDHDRYRSFPLWWDAPAQTLTNLLGQGTRILVDQLVTIEQNQLQLHKNRIEDQQPQMLSADTVAEAIANDLVSKARYLYQLGVRPQLFLSGGIDTAILYALFMHTGVQFNTVDFEHVEYDYFTNANLHAIRNQHWAYKQIHHWQDPTWLATGACGDEFLFRGPNAVATWAAWNNIDLCNLLSKSQGYHVGYFNKLVNQKLFADLYAGRAELQHRYPKQGYLVRHILDMIANDHQHWHLGNTMTWTPFKDLRYTQWILQLDHSDLLDQIIDAKISRLVLRKLHAPAEQMISTTKNHNPRAGLNR